MSVIDGCEWSAWRVLAKKPPVDQVAEVNPEPVGTQKHYRSSNPDSPVILATIKIYPFEKEIAKWRTLLPAAVANRKRTERRDVLFDMSQLEFF